MMLRKTKVAAAVGAAFLVAGTAAYAQQPPAGPTIQVYGQVSRTLMFADDGVQSKWFHTDNESSGTRLGVTGGAMAMPGLRAGFRIEFDFQSNESQRVNFGPTGPISNFPAHDEDVGGFAERHADAWLEGGWGRVSIGQGDGAANGASESDLSGTGMANGIGVADVGGGIAHRTGLAFGPSVGATINQQDFESRYDRLMYTTPNFSGFRAQVSHGQSGNFDVKEASLWYGGKLGGFGELAAALGWSEQGSPALTRKDETIGGSISWLHGSGINLTASFTQRTQPTLEATPELESQFMYFKVGYKFGQHAIAVDYAEGTDFVAIDDEAKMYGIGYVWNPIRWLELYAAYKIHEFDRPGAAFDDVKIGHVGTRIRF
jgi:predicted porin